MSVTTTTQDDSVLLTCTNDFLLLRVKQIQNELGTQILADFEEALSVKGVKVHE